MAPLGDIGEIGVADPSFSRAAGVHVSIVFYKKRRSIVGVVQICLPSCKMS